MDAAAAELRSQFGAVPYELRFSLSGRAAVRVLAPAGPVAAWHAEPPDPVAPWSVAASCGQAAGWLVAAEPPPDPGRALDVLQRAVDRRTALAGQRMLTERSAMSADVLESLTHRLRTDVSALMAVAEGALSGMFADEERGEVRRELKSMGTETQRRLSLARAVMTVLAPSDAEPQPLLDVLHAELEGAGVAALPAPVAGERPMTLVPGAGWSACARLLAGALADDERFGGTDALVAVRPDPDGWSVCAGTPADAAPAAWTARALGELVHAGHMAVAAGGRAVALRSDAGGLRVELTLPAAPSAPLE
jgi:signal transduction histidine kinase